MEITITQKNAKHLNEKIKLFVKQQNGSCSTSQAYEFLAHLAGFKNWNVLNAKIKEPLQDSFVWLDSTATVDRPANIEVQLKHQPIVSSLSDFPFCLCFKPNSGIGSVTIPNLKTISVFLSRLEVEYIKSNLETIEEHLNVKGRLKLAWISPEKRYKVISANFVLNKDRGYAQAKLHDEYREAYCFLKVDVQDIESGKEIEIVTDKIKLLQIEEYISNETN